MELNRRLRSVEHLRSANRLVDVPFIASQRARATKRAVRRLIRRFPEIDALASKELEGLRQQRLHHDLERLAAASAAHLRELRFLGRPFEVVLEAAEQGRRLTLVGTHEATQSSSERREIANQVESTIREGTLEEIVWNNGAVGSLTFMTLPIASLDIGYHITASTHRFTTLVELAKQDPEGVISALEPLFRPRPDEPVDELNQLTRALISLLVYSPRRSAEQATAAVRTVLTWKASRRLLRAYLGDSEARAEAPVDLLLKDLVRLWLIGQARTRLELDAARQILVFRTDPGAGPNGAALDPATVRSLTQIVWDNSASGSTVTSSARPRVSVELEGGVHEFAALTPVARRFPELALPALLWAADGE